MMPEPECPRTRYAGKFDKTLAQQMASQPVHQQEIQKLSMKNEF